MFEIEFAERLSALRIKKGVSARDMSLSLGFNPGYINSIESGKALPSMSTFFYICEYLSISPVEFFNNEIIDPTKESEMINDLNKLNTYQLDIVSKLIKELGKNK